MRTAPTLFSLPIFWLPGALVLALTVAGCLESDEELTVRPDGSVAVQISAKGKAKDLADGYSVPLDGPWTAENDATREWIRFLGSDTGSAAVRANLEGRKGRSALLPDDKDIELRVSAQFPSVKELPRFLAPESEAFRTAYLERATDLSVEKKGGRTVYTLERTYRGRTFDRFDPASRMKERLSKELFAKIEKQQPLTEGERAQFATAAVDAMRRAAVNTASEAVASIYTHGDAALALSTSSKVVETIRSEVERVVTLERIDRILVGVFPPAGQPKSGDPDKEVANLERELRETLRTSFERALQSAGTPTAARNAMRGELEWLFTAHDHTDDLGDDTIHLVVHMPGRVVSGNYDEADEGTATWKFGGDTIRDRDRVLRVVSVVE
jgi:hypothetical protein